MKQLSWTTRGKYASLFIFCAVLLSLSVHLAVKTLLSSNVLDKFNPQLHPRNIQLRNEVIDTRVAASIHHDEEGIWNVLKQGMKSFTSLVMAAPSMSVTPKDSQEIKTFLFHLDHQLTEQDTTRAALEQLGIKLGHYLPHNTYMGSTTVAQAKQAKRTIRGVRWVGEMKSHHKMPHVDMLKKHVEKYAEQSQDFEAQNERKCAQKAGQRRVLSEEEKAELEFVVLASVAQHNTKEELEQEAKLWEDEIKKEITTIKQVTILAPSKQKIALGVSGSDNAVRLSEWLTKKGLVHWVEIKPPTVTHNKYAAMLSQSYDAPESKPVWKLGITGNGQYIGIGDTGVDHYHCFFYDEKNAVPFQRLQREQVAESKHRKFHGFWKYMDDLDSEQGHGSHVSGTAAGNAHPTLARASIKEYDSLAKDAKLAFLDAGCDTPNGCTCPQDTQCECDLKPNRICPRKFGVVYLPLDLNDGYFPWFYSKGVRIASNSWGTGYYKDFNFGYSTSTAEIDLFVWNQPDFLPVFAAGNSGGQFGYASLTSESEAKNALVVGASMSSLDSFKAAANYSDYTGIVERIKAELYQTYCLPGSGLFDEQLCNSAKAFTAADCCRDNGKCNGQISSKCCGNQDYEQFPNIGFRCCPACIDFEMAQQPEHFSPNNLALFTARGPAMDGRIKPDVVAVGDKILSTRSQGTLPQRACNANQTPQQILLKHEGTSMAAPVAASAAVLVKQFFEDGYYPSNTENKAAGFKPSAAMLKAVLIHSTQVLTGYIYLMSKHLWWPLQYKQGQRFALRQPYLQGFGRIELGKALLKENGLFIPNKIDRPISTGETHSYCFEVRATKPFRVTLVWSDYPSSPAAKLNIVNDIDLLVVGPDRKVYYGNGERSVIGSTRDEPDYLNNAEQVLFTDVIPGQYNVIIRGQKIPSGKQPYALVISGDLDVLSSCPAVPELLTSELQKYQNLSYAFGILSVIAIPSLAMLALYFYIQFRRVTVGEKGYRDSSMSKTSAGETLYARVEDDGAELDTLRDQQAKKDAQGTVNISPVNLQS